MRSLFQTRAPEPPPTLDPARTEFPVIEGAEMAAVFLGNRVAGDFYDAIRVSPERVLFGLLDVAGRRKDNRAVLNAAQKIFRTLGSDLFARSDINESDAMTELCILMNRGIMEAEDGVRSCPAFLGCYHQLFGTLCYTNAGHAPGLLRDSAGAIELAPRGLPLGLFSHATIDAPTVGMNQGASLLLVSRGVIEGKCTDRKGEHSEYGLERVKEGLLGNSTLGARALCQSILNAVSETCDPIATDDMTALALVRTA
jgi:serine phosphatase RsbU (regulator of sigma subunit)